MKTNRSMNSICHVVVTISFGHVHHHATKAKGDRSTDKPTTLLLGSIILQSSFPSEILCLFLAVARH